MIKTIYFGAVEKDFPNKRVLGETSTHLEMDQAICLLHSYQNKFK